MLKSIKEVNKMNKLYPIGYSPKQLLINNDFQVNQRGQSEYVSKGYSLDMWYFQNYNKANTKLEPTDNGIRMTNNGDSDMAIYQYVYAETKQVVTLVVKVNGQTYSISGLPTGSGETPTIVVEDGKIELNVRYYDTDKRYRVYAMVGVNQIADIEYIDLFEGKIAYPHVKEDYAKALMGCQDWLIVVKFNEWSHIPFTNSLTNAYVKIPIPKTFDFSNKNTNLGKLKECTVLGDSSIGIESISVQSNYEKNNILELYIKLTKSISTNTGAFETKGNGIVISISREPL